MSILIKGMEMPKTGEYRCVIRKWQQGGTITIDLYGEEELCGTIVPVPPHGDLIDRDKLREKEFINDGDAYAVVMSRDIRNAPTIIPAEPSEEQREYEAQVEAAQYCEMYEPTYDPKTGAL